MGELLMFDCPYTIFTGNITCTGTLLGLQAAYIIHVPMSQASKKDTHARSSIMIDTSIKTRLPTDC